MWSSNELIVCCVDIERQIGSERTVKYIHRSIGDTSPAVRALAELTERLRQSSEKSI